MDFEQFEGIVEMDETYFLYSEKGKRKVEGRKARKRGGVTLDLYSHVNEDLQVDAAIRFENEFFKDSSDERMIRE